MTGALLPVALLFFSLVLGSCAGVTPLTAERPREEVSRVELKRETSSLAIPIEASTDDLARVLNQTVRTELYKGSTTVRGVSATVVRNGAIIVSASDNYLYVTLPIVLSLSYGMFETPAIPLGLKFRATAGVTSDWRLHTEISYLGLSDLLAEEIGFGPLSIKPRSIVEGISKPVQSMLSDLLAQKINDLFSLKAQVAKVWNRAQKPVLLDKSYNAWLKLTPRGVMLSPLYARNNRVRLSVGISMFAELVVGPEPAERPPLPLPDLTLVSTFDKAFRIALNADLFYTDLRAIAAPLLLDKQFTIDGNNLVIKEFDLYGNGDKLVIKLRTEGALAGLFYLTAKPVFDPRTAIFSVEDVDFDMQTRSILLRSADWFLHGSIREIIREKLTANLAGQLEQSRQMAGKALAQVRLADHVFLKGNVQSLKLSDMIVQKDKLSIQLYTEGEAGIVIQ